MAADGRVLPIAAPAPLPVVLAGPGPGQDGGDMRVSALGGAYVPFRVAATVAVVPGFGADGVLVDLEYALRSNDAPTEAVDLSVWLTADAPDSLVTGLTEHGVSVLRELNPQFLRLITPPGSRAVVRLPVGTADATRAAYAELPANRRVTFREHQVARGETLGHLSRRYGVPVADIRSANRNIAPNRLRIGMTLIIPVSPAFDPSAVAATEQPTARRRSTGAAAGGRVLFVIGSSRAQRTIRLTPSEGWR